MTLNVDLNVYSITTPLRNSIHDEKEKVFLFQILSLDCLSVFIFLTNGVQNYWLHLTLKSYSNIKRELKVKIST